MLNALPDHLRQQAIKAYRLFRENPYHNSLRFKLVNPMYLVYSVRIGIAYRALGVRNPKNRIVWYWIGSHAEYNAKVTQPPPDLDN